MWGLSFMAHVQLRPGLQAPLNKPSNEECASISSLVLSKTDFNHPLLHSERSAETQAHQRNLRMCLLEANSCQQAVLDSSLSMAKKRATAQM